VKEITKLGKTSLSDFTLCEQSFFTRKNPLADSYGLAPVHKLFVPPMAACLEV
jgi:hypothetical protein